MFQDSPGTSRNNSRVMKEIEYWGFVALVESREEKIRVRVIVRRVGNGQLHFWSVMPHSKLKKRDSYKLASETIADE